MFPFRFSPFWFDKNQSWIQVASDLLFCEYKFTKPQYVALRHGFVAPVGRVKCPNKIKRVNLRISPRLIPFGLYKQYIKKSSDRLFRQFLLL